MSNSVSGALFENVSDLSEQLIAGIELYINSAASQLQGEMKKDAPWTDRTGEARRRLTATTSKEQNYVYVITLAHGVNYGVYLELAHEKKYAIIQPTILKEAPKIFADLKHILFTQARRG